MGERLELREYVQENVPERRQVDWLALACHARLGLAGTLGDTVEQAWDHLGSWSDVQLPCRPTNVDRLTSVTGAWSVHE